MARLRTRARRTLREAAPPPLQAAPARPGTAPLPAAWLQWQCILGNARAGGLMRQPATPVPRRPAVASISLDAAERSRVQRRADGGSEAALRQGSSGPAVVHLQSRLNSHGAAPPLAEDGRFGPLTHAATLAYQRSHGLVPDAVVGARTREDSAADRVRQGELARPPGGVLRRSVFAVAERPGVPEREREAAEGLVRCRRAPHVT